MLILKDANGAYGKNRCHPIASLQQDARHDIIKPAVTTVIKNNGFPKCKEYSEHIKLNAIISHNL